MGDMAFVFLSYLGMGWAIFIIPLLRLRNKLFGDPYNGNEGCFIEFHAVSCLAAVATILGFAVLAMNVTGETFLIAVMSYLLVTMLSCFMYHILQ